MAANNKKYEKSIKEWLKKLVAVDLPGKIIDETYNFSSNKKIKKILLLRHDRFGDVLISVPFVRELRARLQDAEIDVLLSFKNYSAKSAFAGLVNNYYHVTSNLIKSLWLLRKLRNKKYDLIIDLIDNESLNSNIIMNIVNPGLRIGFDKSNRFNYDYVIPAPDKAKQHPAERLLPFLHFFGFEYTDLSIELSYQLSESEKTEAKSLLANYIDGYTVAINISGSGANKYWGSDNFVLLINRLKVLHPEFRFLIFATDRYLHEAERISEKTNSKIAPIQNKFNIYAAMLNECQLIITPDTSAVHLASALKISVIAMYLVTNPNGDCPWTPVGVPNRILITHKSMQDINPEFVVEKFQELAGEVNL